MADADTRWLLDTSVLVDLLRGETRAQNWIDSLTEDARCLSVITAAELLAGCVNRAEQRKVEREMELYTMLWVSEEISQTALEFYKRFHLSHGVGFFDCVIAATAKQERLRLATLNLKHFSPLPGITVQKPY